MARLRKRERKYKLLTSEIKGWTLLVPIDITKIRRGYSFFFFLPKNLKSGKKWPNS